MKCSYQALLVQILRNFNHVLGRNRPKVNRSAPIFQALLSLNSNLFDLTVILYTKKCVCHIQATSFRHKNVSILLGGAFLFQNKFQIVNASKDFNYLAEIKMLSQKIDLEKKWFFLMKILEFWQEFAMKIFLKKRK